MKKTTRIAALLAAAALIFGGLFFSCSDGEDEAEETKKLAVEPTTASVKVNETVTLSAKNAEGKTVTWTSSDTGKATVANGVVTGVAVGTVTITASAEGMQDAAVAITVEAAEEPKTEINVGDFFVSDERKMYIEIKAGNKVEVTGVNESPFPADYSVDNKTVTISGDGFSSFTGTISDDFKTITLNNMPFGESIVTVSLIFSAEKPNFSSPESPNPGPGGEGGNPETPGEPVDYSIDNFTDAIGTNADITISSDNPAKLTASTAAAIDEGKIIIFSPSAGNLRLRSDGTINYNGDSKRYVAVDTSKFGASGNLTVSFNIKVNKSSNAVADKADKGIVILSSSAEDCPQNSNTFVVPETALAKEENLPFSSGTTKTLSATVSAGTKVYLFLSRNGATVEKDGKESSTGGIDVTGISVKTAQ